MRSMFRLGPSFPYGSVLLPCLLFAGQPLLLRLVCLALLEGFGQLLSACEGFGFGFFRRGEGRPPGVNVEVPDEPKDGGPDDAPWQASPGQEGSGVGAGNPPSMWAS